MYHISTPPFGLPVRFGSAEALVALAPYDTATNKMTVIKVNDPRKFNQNEEFLYMTYPH